MSQIWCRKVAKPSQSGDEPVTSRGARRPQARRRGHAAAGRAAGGDSRNRQKPRVRSACMSHHRPTAPAPHLRAERRLILPPAAATPTAQARVLAQYEPMMRVSPAASTSPAANPRTSPRRPASALLDAMRTWDPDRGVPFSNFAWLCATREARNAVRAARAPKHHLLTTATALDVADGSDQRLHRRRTARRLQRRRAPPPTRPRPTARRAPQRRRPRPRRQDPRPRTAARPDRPHAHPHAARAPRARARQPTTTPTRDRRHPAHPAPAPSTTRSSARATSSADPASPDDYDDGSA